MQRQKTRTSTMTTTMMMMMITTRSNFVLLFFLSIVFGSQVRKLEKAEKENDFVGELDRR